MHRTAMVWNPVGELVLAPLIGASKEKLGQAACCAVKRLHLDARIAKCAQRNGVNLFEKARGNSFWGTPDRFLYATWQAACSLCLGFPA